MRVSSAAGAARGRSAVQKGPFTENGGTLENWDHGAASTPSRNTARLVGFHRDDCSFPRSNLAVCTRSGPPADGWRQEPQAWFRRAEADPSVPQAPETAILWEDQFWESKV